MEGGLESILPNQQFITQVNRSPFRQVHVPVIKLVPVAGLVDKDKLAGGGVGHGTRQPVGQLAPAAPELDESVTVLHEARLVQLAEKTRVLD